MTNFIPIFEYAKKHKVTNQTVYRWIRENKFSTDAVKKEIITLERLRIKENVPKP